MSLSSAPFSLSALPSVRTRRPGLPRLRDGAPSGRPQGWPPQTPVCTTRGTAGPTGGPCGLLPGGSSPSLFSLCLFLSLSLCLSISLPPCLSLSLSGFISDSHGVSLSGARATDFPSASTQATCSIFKTSGPCVRRPPRSTWRWPARPLFTLQPPWMALRSHLSTVHTAQ